MLYLFFSTRCVPPKALSCTLVLFAALIAPAARADDDSLKEVTVTAGKIAQKRFDAPASISTVDGEAIRASGPQVNLSDALSGVPGVVALIRNNYAQDIQISIRGFGARAAFGTQGIRLIADDIPMSIPDGTGQASSMSLSSVDRIEVLRGPLAQLYGNSSGGVIQTFTREAGAVPELGAQLYTGSFGLARYDAQASGRSANGQVGIVADASTFNTDGWRANSAAKREQLNTVLTMDPQAGTRVKLVFNIFDSPTAQDPLGLTAAQLQKNPQQAGNNAVLDQTRKSVQQGQLGLVLQQKLPGDLQFQGRVYYGTRDNLQYQASSATTSPANATGTWVGLGREYGGIGLQLKGQQNQWAVPMEWVAGYDADKSSEHRQGGAAKLGYEIGNPTTDQQNIATNNDVFAQTNWYLSDHWTLVAGARYSQVTLSNDDHLTSSSPDSGSVTYRKLTPVIGLTWHATDALNLYANAGQGFETPTLSNVVYSNVGGTLISRFNPNLQAATSQTLELGAKWLPSASQSLDTALFHTVTHNEIVTSISSAGKTSYVNAPSTLRQGLELAYRVQLAPHWSTRWSGTLMRAQYSSAYNSGSTAVASGNAMPSIPEKQALGSLSWSQQAHKDLTPMKLSGAEATLEWVARSQLWANDANTAAAAGQGLFNLRLREGVQWGALAVEGFAAINNLANRQYVGTVITNQSAGQYYEPGLPRNWVLGLCVSVQI